MSPANQAAALAIRTLAKGFARLWMGLAPGRTALSQDQIKTALGPDTDPWALTESMFTSLAMIPLELALARCFKPSVADECVFFGPIRVDIEGGFQQAPCGAIAVAGHLGNFELCLWAAAQRWPVYVVSKEVGNIDGFWRSVRQDVGLTQLDDEGSLRAIRQALGRRAVVVFATDQHANKEHSVQTHFFGQPCHTHRAPALFALRHKVPVHYVHTERLTPFHHRVVISPPLEVPNKGGPKSRILELTQRFCTCCEASIRRVPGQWTWLHRRWKTY